MRRLPPIYALWKWHQIPTISLDTHTYTYTSTIRVHSCSFVLCTPRRPENTILHQCLPFSFYARRTFSALAFWTRKCGKVTLVLWRRHPIAPFGFWLMINIAPHIYSPVVAFRPFDCGRCYARCAVTRHVSVVIEKEGRGDRGKWNESAFLDDGQVSFECDMVRTTFPNVNAFEIV